MTPPSARARALLAAAAGALLVAAFPPFDLWPLALLATAMLCWLLSWPGPVRQAGAQAGFWFGMTFFAGSVYWVVPVMRDYGGLPWIVALLVLLLFTALLAAFFAGFAALVQHLVNRMGPAPALILAPAVWVAAELARNHLLTGFPWVRLGNALHTIPPLLQLASVTGIYGLSFLLLALASSLALLARQAQRATGAIYLSLLLLMVVGIYTWGSGRVSRLRGEAEPSRAVDVACVQGNVPQDRKWSPEAADEILTRHLEFTRLAASRGADLVVWAESSLPFPLRGHAEFGSRVRQVVQDTGSALILGSLDWRTVGQDGRQVYNSAFLVAAGEPAQLAYDKVHLVPFGEYVPLRQVLFFASKLVEEVGEMSAGAGQQHLAAGSAVQGVPALGILICYEIIFPGLARQAVNAGAQVLLNLTNDAWFGNTAAPYQHFSEAVVRAVETGRWVVRAANTGISGIIAPSGEVVARTELGVAGLAQAEIFPRSERTLYVRSGDVFAWACVILTVALVVLGRRPAAPGSSQLSDEELG